MLSFPKFVIKLVNQFWDLKGPLKNLTTLYNNRKKLVNENNDFQPNLYKTYITQGYQMFFNVKSMLVLHNSIKNALKKGFFLKQFLYKLK